VSEFYKRKADAILHRLWTKAVDAPGYNKEEWLNLEKVIWNPESFIEPTVGLVWNQVWRKYGSLERGFPAQDWSDLHKMILTIFDGAKRAAPITDRTKMHVVMDEVDGVPKEMWDAAAKWATTKSTPLDDMRALHERTPRTVGISTHDPEATANILAAMEWAAKTDPPRTFADDLPQPDHVIKESK
jgi:hypothetical protein